MISQTAQQVPAIDGANGNAGAMGVRNALLATPDAANYPEGSDVPLLLVLTNNGNAEDSLTGVSSPVAGSIELSGAIKVPGYGSVTVSADSKLTATLTGAKKTLCFGQAFPVTFSFAQAGQLTLNVPIQIPKERTGPRETIDIQPPHPTPLWLTGAHEAAATAAASPAPSSGPSAAPGTSCNG
jgi:copper(I)-binding protein